MEATINFEKSDFVALKGVVDQSDDNSLFGYDPNSNSLYGYRPNSVENLFVQINNLILPGTLDVDQLLARPSIVKLIDKFINVWMVRAGSWFKKNVAISDDMRNYGNVEYGRRNFTLAAYLYTMAIVYAPNVSENNDVPKDNVPEELSLAFGNRSAVFFQLGLHEACLEDIAHALATGYSRSKLPKLLLRKIECLIALNRLGAAKKAWDHFVATIGTEPKDDERVLKIRLQLLNIGSDDDNHQKQDNQMSLPSTNSMLPAINYLNKTGRYKPSADLAPVSAKLEPRYSSAKGRHLVAKVDIEPGDILMVESPYTTVLDKKYEFHYCHHCSRRLENDLEKSGVKGQLCINGALVPCTSCTRVLYCSTVCRTESWRLYHQFECGLQPVLGQLASDAHSSNGIAALRIFLATGLNVIQQVATRNDEDEEVVSIPVLGDDVASHYEQVYRLVHHRDKASPFELSDCVNTAAILVQLAKKCGLVHTDDQAKLAGTILLRHLLQLRVNLHRIPSVKRTEKCSHDSFDIASGVYPFTSCLFNHSCEPNTVSTWYHGTLMLHRASRRIVAGTEVTANYGVTFDLTDRAERQKTLFDQFRFVCDCSRCVLEGRDGLDGKYLPIGCQDCGCPLTRESSSSTTFHCPRLSCGATVKLSDMKRAYTRIETQLTTLRNLVESYQQLREAGGSCTLAQFVEWERQLAALSSVKGMRNYWKLGILYDLLADHYEHSYYPGTARKAKQSFKRVCEITEVVNGISLKLYLHTVRLGKLFDNELHTLQDFQFRDYRQVVKRIIELLRLFSLANVQQENGLDLMVDGATILWKGHGQLQRMKRLVKTGEVWNRE